MVKKILTRKEKLKVRLNRLERTRSLILGLDERVKRAPLGELLIFKESVNELVDKELKERGFEE